MSEPINECQSCGGDWRVEALYLREIEKYHLDTIGKCNVRIEEQGKEIDRLRAQVESDYKEAVYLFSLCAPQCRPLDSTSGVLSQLSNYIAGLNQDIDAAHAEIDRLRGEYGEALGRSNRYAYELQKAEAEIARLRYGHDQHALICETLGVSASPDGDGDTALEAVVRLRAEIAQLRAELEDARDAALYMRIVLTNMTQDEQMVRIYEKWPWLKLEEEQ